MKILFCKDFHGSQGQTGKILMSLTIFKHVFSIIQKFKNTSIFLFNNMSMKKIYLYSPRPDFHSLYHLLIQNPPEGYEVIQPQFTMEKTQQSLRKSKIARFIYKRLIKKLINPIKNEDKKFIFKKIPSADMIFSVGRLVLKKKIPHVIEVVDKLNTLTGYDNLLFQKNKKYIEDALSSPSCKRIICWTEGTKNDFINELDSKNFIDKLEVVNLAIKPRTSFVKKYNEKDAITLLFVGSINNPDDFKIKGGLETIETFKLLQKHHKNLKLIVRCKIPQDAKKKYSALKNLEIIEEFLSKEDLNALYENADIFMTPSHNLNGLAPLEAMSYELPLIGINTWSVDEVIMDEFNGFLVPKSEKIPYEEKKFHLDIRSPEFLAYISQVDEALIARLAEKTEILIKDAQLRKTFGKNGRLLVEEGKFSLKERNKRLKKIFDEALRN